MSRTRYPGTVYGTLPAKPPAPRKTIPDPMKEYLKARDQRLAEVISAAMAEAVTEAVQIRAAKAAPQGPAGLGEVDALALQSAWLDLEAAILKPRKRTVLRDWNGRITGLKEG